MAASTAEFEIYQDARNEWRWRLRAKNGEVIADGSEGYKVREDCVAGTRLVRVLAPKAIVQEA